MKRTILVVVKGYPRLSETFIAQELRSLEKAGFRLHIVSLRRATDKATHPVHREMEALVTYLPEYLHEAPAEVFRALLKLIKRPGFFKALSRFLSDLSRDVSRARARRFGQAMVLAAKMPPDATFLYAHFIHSPASVTAYASMMSGLEWACSAHAKDIWTTPDRDLQDKLHHARFVVTCTRAGLDRLNALAPKQNPVHLMYHGLDTGRFPRMSAPLSERNGQAPEKPVRLLTVARAVEKKGLDTLLAALALLPGDLNWQWTHIGGGALTTSLKAFAQEKGMGARCHFLGAKAQAEVFEAYATSDIFVLPCRIARDGDRDGLPNVLLEAAGMGLALVSSPVSGVTEFIDDGVSGALADPDAPERLAQVLTRLATNPLERYRLGREAARRVRADFDHDATIGQLITLFPPDLASMGPEERRLEGVT